MNQTTTNDQHDSEIYLNVSVEGAGADEISIRVEVDAPDVCLVTGEGADNLGCLQVPDLECTAEGAGTHQLL